MRPLLVLTLVVPALALAACGGGDGDSEATSGTTTGVNIVADCGPDPLVGTDESSVTAEGVGCSKALNVASAFPEAGCDFSVEPECNVIGYTCIRASEEGADTVVFECTKGNARITIEAPHVE